MIDIHAHLCFPEFDKDREEVIAEAKKRMTAIIASSARYDEGLKVLDLAEKHKGFVFATLGHHPTEGDNSQETLELVEMNKDKIVAVGEVGLDFHWVKEEVKRERQKEIFLKFIDLAESLKKPLVIHSWDAERECFDLVKDRNLDCAFHCYSGKRDLAMEIVERGFFISVSTNIMFSKNIRKVVRDAPLERILLETDSPFLDPDRDRKRNVPWNIQLSAEKIAQIRGISAKEVIKKTTESAVNLFNLPLKI